jgi:hypothetical protein
MIHVHMMIAIPPKYAISQVVGFIKGKSAVHLARVYGERKRPMPLTLRDKWESCGIGGADPQVRAGPLDPLFARRISSLPLAVGRPGGRPRKGASPPPFTQVRDKRAK